MAEAVRDQNHVPSLLGVLDSDGVTTIRIKATPSGKLAVDDGVDGTDNGPENADRDQNHVTSLMGVSSDDLVTPVVAYATIDGKLKVQST